VLSAWLVDVAEPLEYPDLVVVAVTVADAPAANPVTVTTAPEIEAAPGDDDIAHPYAAS